MRFATLDEWLAWQETLHPKPIDLGLERVARVADRLGLLHPTCPVITVAGTNGKGSTVAMLESIYRTAGFRVCAYTSPHLVRYNERIRIHGRLATDSELREAFEAVDTARGEVTLSYFEFGTVAALWLFREAGADVMVLEVGLGGRLDAVNIVDADVAVVTSVGIDHQEWLGADRESIGAEKAGIFRAGCPAVCGDRQPPASVRGTADRLGARWIAAGEDFGWMRQGARWSFRGPDGQDWDDLPLPPLTGEIQLDNAATALAVVAQLLPRLPVTREAVADGLRKVRLAGRFQQIRSEPTVIVDVAHNPLGAEALAVTLGERPARGHTLAVVAMMADKDVDGFIRALAPQISHWFAGGLPEVPRASTGEALCARLRAGVSSPVSCHETVTQAYAAACAAAAPGDRVLVMGSFCTVAAVMALEGVA
jgi:dihydrofolate synthase / folylpolyglutamate synthase